MVDPQMANLIADLARELGEIRRIDHFLLKALTKLTGEHGFQAAAVCKLAADSCHRLIPVAADGISRTQFEKRRHRNTMSLSERCLQRMQAMALETDAGLPSDIDPLAEGATAIVAVPMVELGKPMGTLTVARARGVITPEETAGLQALAALLSCPLTISRLEIDLLGQRQRWDDLLHEIPAAVVQINRDGLVERWNLRLSTLLGLSDHETIGQSIWRLLPPSLSELLRYLCEKANIRRSPASEVIDLSEHQHGPLLSAQMVHVTTLALIASDEDSPSGYLVIFNELPVPGARTAAAGSGDSAPGTGQFPRAKSDEVRVRLVGNTDSVRDDQEKFIALIQHELRTPITSMKGAIHLLLDAPGDSVLSEHRPLVEIIDRNTQRLTHLIGDMLEVMGILKGELTLICERLDLRDCVKAAARDAGPITRQYDVASEVIVPDHPVIFNGDASRLQEAFRHLIDNAMKFSPPGSTIYVILSVLDEDACVDVVDYGPGIPESFLPHAFEMFTQSDHPLTRTRGGNGLGLFIAKSLAELHGGSVEIHRTGSEGTTMQVRLPLKGRMTPAMVMNRQTATPSGK